MSRRRLARTRCADGDAGVARTVGITMKISQVLIFYLVVLAWSDALCGEIQKKTINTPQGPITTTTTTVEPAPQEIRLASAKDIKAFDAYAAQGAHFVATYLPKVKKPSLEDFDEAFRLWQTGGKRRFTEKQVVEILGACLGKQLIADFQMEWVVVKDQYGTDFAVRGKTYEVISFPFASVAKRIESGKHDFMSGIYHIIKSGIEKGDYKTR